MSQQPPSNPNQPAQGQSPFWGNMQPPPQWQKPQMTNQPFNPQYPSGQYPPLPQQGNNQSQQQNYYPPQQGYTQYPQGYPQQPYQQPPMMQPTPTPPKKKRGKGLIIGAIVLVIVLALCGVIGSALSHSAVATTSGVGGSNTTTASSSSSSNVVAHVGQTISIQSVSCTLASVHTLDTGQSDVAPKAGHEYIYVHITLKNTGNSEQTYNPYDFHVKSGTGDITVAL